MSSGIRTQALDQNETLRHQIVRMSMGQGPLELHTRVGKEKDGIHDI